VAKPRSVAFGRGIFRSGAAAYASARGPGRSLPQREHLAGPGGLELPTSCAGDSCPLHLGHRPIRDAGRGPNRPTMALQAISRTGKNRVMAPSARFERATSRSGTARAIPCTTRAWSVREWSVREESNLHAEATGLRPAERTTCSTHGWVPYRSRTGLAGSTGPRLPATAKGTSRSGRIRTCGIRCVGPALWPG
jgi:hypothetical protein